MISVLELATYTLLPIAALLAAGFFAIARPAGPRMRSAIMHLAAGVVFAVVALELLPNIIHSNAIVAVVIGFSAGTVLMLVLRELLGHGEHDEDEKSNDGGATKHDDHEAGGADHATGDEHGAAVTGMVVAIAVDLVVDGIMLGLGFAAGERAGVLLAIALTLETVSLGLAVATTLRQRGGAKGRVAAVLGVLGLSLAVGAAAGGLGLRYAPPSVLPGLLAFGAAALLFLVTEELLEEAHEVKETPILTGMFFVGFLALMVLEMAGVGPEHADSGASIPSKTQVTHDN